MSHIFWGCIIISRHAQVVSDGSVDIGCGASSFVLEHSPHIIIVCHYELTGNTSTVAPLSGGVDDYPSAYAVLEEYELPDYSLYDKGCPAA